MDMIFREAEPFYGEKTDLSCLTLTLLAQVMLVERGRVTLQGKG
jgi:hypothetical protein